MVGKNLLILTILFSYHRKNTTAVVLEKKEQTDISVLFFEQWRTSI
jgi:hypothetical protein